MTRPIAPHLIRKALYRLDSAGYPKFVHDFMPAQEAEALAAASGPDHVALTYGEYLARQDPDDESKAREARRLARNGYAPAPVLSCVISGTIAGHTRATAAAHMQAKGYRVAPNVTAATGLLITGEKPGAAKLSAARALGVKVAAWGDVA